MVVIRLRSTLLRYHIIKEGGDTKTVLVVKEVRVMHAHSQGSGKPECMYWMVFSSGVSLRRHSVPSIRSYTQHPVYEYCMTQSALVHPAPSQAFPVLESS